MALRSCTKIGGIDRKYLQSQEERRRRRIRRRKRGSSSQEV
jgi:hypothetical protein